MSDLQHAVGVAGGSDERVRLPDGFGDGLFNEHVGARTQEIERNLVVRWCRCHDTDCIDLAQQFVIISHRSHASFCADPRARRYLEGAEVGEFGKLERK